MIEGILRHLPMMKTPDWLASAEIDRPVRFPLEHIVTDSLYYPASGLNGTPIKYLSGHVLSFIYADYAISKEQLLGNLNGDGENCGFQGYTSVLQREVFREDIVPSGWAPPLVRKSSPYPVCRRVEIAG